MSRDIKQCTPELQKAYELFCYEMDGADIPFILTCAKRTQQEQDALWEQGRSRPGPIVTWTRHSKHIEGKAFDFVILKDGKPDWKMEDKKSWEKAVEIGLSLGLKQVVGKDGRVKEYAHFEI
jgi:peptidoglycan LD-endopeptidase CwlK